MGQLSVTKTRMEATRNLFGAEVIRQLSVIKNRMPADRDNGLDGDPVVSVPCQKRYLVRDKGAE
jgi:hypothetical protein